METQSVSVLFCVCSQQGGIRPSQKLKEVCFQVSYANLHTGLWTIKLAIEVITSVSHKISLTLLQAVKSNSFFRNNTVVIGHSSSMWLTDRAIVQMRVTFCDTQMKVEIFAHCFVFRWICIFGVGHLQIPRVPMLFSSSRCWNIFCFILLIIWQMVALIFRVRMCFVFTVDIWLWRAKRVEKEWEFPVSCFSSL